jgi:hypothetical protein
MTTLDAGELDAALAEAAVADAVAEEAAEAAGTKAGAADGVCFNCGATRSGRFCADCGQKALPLAPTLGYFVHELTHEVLNVDGKIFRSLRLLLTRPGFLTREIFLGRRASYVSPIRLYLVVSVLSFALAAMFGGLDPVNFQYTADPGEAVDPLQVERVADAERTLTQAVYVWLPRAMFVLVPLFAALVMLFRRKTAFTYPQHLYFALHVHAAWFLGTAVDSLAEAIPLPRVAPAVDIATELYMLAYVPIAFMRAYETTLWGAIWRTAIIVLLYFLALMVTLTAIALPTVWPIMFGQPS